VTIERHPVPGCRVQSLGVMQYVPVASPSYIKRYLAEGFTAPAMAEAPSLAWNRDIHHGGEYGNHRSCPRDESIAGARHGADIRHLNSRVAPSVPSPIFTNVAVKYG
jgi:hypothetical protein